MKKKKVRTPRKEPLAELADLIHIYTEASRADEMKGGGDPNNYEIIEAELELSRAKLNAQIQYIRELLKDVR